MKRLILLLVILLALPLVSAKEGQIKLLAVSDDGTGNLTGSVADLFLDIEPGKGRVFIETFPLTKTDTQITTRFAKEIACKYTDIDCSQYDFFYTIKADSAIIGGPSAGAATTVLTVALLKDLKLDPSVAATGTINSGNVIGVVSGLKEKIQAAGEANLTKVLVARGVELVKDKNNQTINLTEFGKSINVTIIQVDDLDEALYQFTGLKPKPVKDTIDVDPTYSNVMKKLAEDLCQRSKLLFKEADSKDDFGNLTRRADEFYSEGHYYSSASQCFGINVQLQEKILKSNATNATIAKQALQLLRNIRSLDNNLTNTSRSTITDLEAYMTAKERLADAVRSLSTIPSDSLNDDIETLAYAYERYYSALSWIEFFGSGGKSYVLDSSALKDSCIQKLSETSESYDYVASTISQDITDIEKDVELARLYQAQGNYELCLFTASKAKARINTILSSLYIAPDQVNLSIELKLRAARKAIIDEADKGIFPILGYSYYEYAQDLKKTDPFSGLLYAEYSLEISNLDLYLNPKKSLISQSLIDFESIKLLAIFLWGLALGALLVHFMKRNKRRK